MSLWSIMNWVAWIISAILFGLIMIDFIRVEKAHLAAKKNNQNGVNN